MDLAYTAVDYFCKPFKHSGQRGNLLEQPLAALRLLTGTQVLYNAPAAQPLFCNVRSCGRACVPLAQSWSCSTVGGAGHCNVAGKLGERLVKEVGHTVG